MIVVPSDSCEVAHVQHKVQLMHDVSHRVLDDRADALIADHENMMRELTKMRQSRLTQQQVAERMGVSQPCVSQFERYDANPTLDTVRRYAMAVGARIETRVIDDEVPYLKAKDTLIPIQQIPAETPKIVWESSRTTVLVP